MTCAFCHLIILGDWLHKASAFRLVVDRTIIVSTIQTPIVAVALLFGVFFIFNIEYPPEASAALEFMQR